MYCSRGRTSAAEIAELSEEVLHIAKHYMVADTTIFEESVAGLFLVYSLLNLQPYPNFASLRLVPEDIPAIQHIESVARKEKRYDVLYILASVLIKGPCQFHAAERERGMEPAIKKYLDGFKSIDSVRGVRSKGVFYRQTEELDLIRELGVITKKYSETKAQGPLRSERITILKAGNASAVPLVLLMSVGVDEHLGVLAARLPSSVT
ncbi:hypothetical protein RR46_00146 [Papilio xuthus]|uniref:Uncharacterized protein n=1 Tax=Papilio xuthus TaxID=66420 RepID=A0A0N1PJJ0_PAPXU|nr:hypothetical protein RR46_00146 [Papilio xuthus]